jgi:hypothetical protein
MPRVQRRFLLHSRWTAQRPLDGSAGECHFEVEAITRAGAVTLRAVLTDRRYVVDRAALDDAAAWSLGWQPLPAPIPDEIAE